jgi:hypothetical protein
MIQNLFKRKGIHLAMHYLLSLVFGEKVYVKTYFSSQTRRTDYVPTALQKLRSVWWTVYYYLLCTVGYSI